MNRTKTRRIRSDGQPDERGASAVEFAIILPLFLLFLFGIVQYGTIFLVRNQMTEAVSDAARTAVNYTDVGDAQSQANSALNSDLKRDGAGLMSADCSNPSVTCQVQVVGTCSPPTGYKCLQVSITYNYSRDPVIDFPFLPTPSSLTASSTVLVTDSAS